MRKMALGLLPPDKAKSMLETIAEQQLLTVLSLAHYIQIRSSVMLSDSVSGLAAPVPSLRRLPPCAVDPFSDTASGEDDFDAPLRHVISQLIYRTLSILCRPPRLPTNWQSIPRMLRWFLLARLSLHIMCGWLLICCSCFTIKYLWTNLAIGGHLLSSGRTKNNTVTQ